MGLLTVNSMYFDAAYCAPDLFLIFSSVFCKGKTIFSNTGFVVA